MTLKTEWPLYVGNVPRTPNLDLEVFDKYSGELAARVALADGSIIDEAIGMAAAAAPAMRAMKAYERQAVLNHCVRRFEAQQDQLAHALCVEAGKPIKDANGEVTRLIDTFRYAAEESVRLGGEILEMAISAGGAGRQGMVKHVPIGPCSFISPFNFPLNLAAHKIAPALAVGCPFVLKPASRTPLGALMIGEILAECDLPAGAFSILPCARDAADAFTTDPRLKLLSFTGSPAVGWALKAKAGKTRVILELGGNAAVIVDADTAQDPAILDDAIDRIVTGAFYQSGQSCIGVQRVLIHRDIYAVVKAKLVKATEALVKGDPKDADVFIGPMISEGEAERLEGWIAEAVKGGATVLCGGKREGAMLDATLLEGVSPRAKISDEEAFGPVACLSPFDDFDAALAQVNDSRFGLQAGIFTRDLHKAMRAWDVLDVGGVIVGDIPSWRVDHMPYGGVKDSGHGREGIRYAMEHMTEPRLLVIRAR